MELKKVQKKSKKIWIIKFFLYICSIENITNMKYWYELLTADYDHIECYIPDGTVAQAKKYALKYMKENGIETAIMSKNSLATSNLLDFIDLKIS